MPEEEDIKRFILRKLVRHRIWTHKHTSIHNLQKGLPDYLRSGREVKKVLLFRNELFMELNNIPSNLLDKDNLLPVLIYSDEFIEMTDDDSHFRHYIALKDFWQQSTKISNLHEHLLSRIKFLSRIVMDKNRTIGNLHQTIERKNQQFLKSHDEETWEELKKAKRVVDLLIESSPQLAEKVLKKEEEE